MHRLGALEVLVLADNRIGRFEALRTLGSLTHHDEGISELIANAPFVRTGSGKRFSPKALYDPRVPELAALLAASADVSFPAAPFDDPRVLETLAGLGMRAGVTRAAVLEAALAAAARRQGCHQ